MKIIRTIKEMNDIQKENAHQTVGFVPTMGFLHEGHLSLVKQAQEENDVVIMSIFVNPLQFGPNEDFDTYPRDEQQDAIRAEEAGVQILFMPSVTEMYPEEMGIKLIVEKGTEVLCGRSRPGHFDGVGTVLTKLFHIVQPNNAYFGLKDAQQFAIVHHLVEQLNFPLQVIGLPTIREADGLAKSSRNVYLSAEERIRAVTLSKSLQFAQEQIVDGERNPAIIISEVTEMLQRETNSVIDYVELLSYPDLGQVSTINTPIIIAVAVQFNQARLIDNILLTADGAKINRF